MKCILIILFSLSFFSFCSKPFSNDSLEHRAELFPLVGYATLNGGTTGGAAGATVIASDYLTLKNYLESTSPLIVTVNTRIYNGDKGGSIKIASNKTLLGTGSSAFLDGIGLTIYNSNNVIIRNVKITLTSITNKTDTLVYDPDGDEGLAQIIVNGGDCISIFGTSTNIWIDHCELYSLNPSIQPNKDLYDGLIDIKHQTAYITISYCYFHDHYKVHLVGSSDTDLTDRRITFHHNWYKNVKSRLPLYRAGQCHVYNNYFNSIGSSAIDTRMGACVRVENNRFETVKSPIVASGTTLGKYHISGNSYSGITGTAAPTVSTCNLSIPYIYTAQSASTVKTEVTTKAGVGKI